MPVPLLGPLFTNDNHEVWVNRYRDEYEVVVTLKWPDGVRVGNRVLSGLTAAELRAIASALANAAKEG